MDTCVQSRLGEIIDVVGGNWRCLVKGPITLENESKKRFEASKTRQFFLDIIKEAFIERGDPLATSFFIDRLFFGDMEQTKMVYELFLHSLYSDNDCEKEVINAMSDFYLMDSGDPLLFNMINEVRMDSWICPEDVKGKLQLKDTHVIHA